MIIILLYLNKLNVRMQSIRLWVLPSAETNWQITYPVSDINIFIFTIVTMIWFSVNVKIKQKQQAQGISFDLSKLMKINKSKLYIDDLQVVISAIWAIKYFRMWSYNWLYKYRVYTY